MKRRIAENYMGVPDRPRISVMRSLKNIFLQAIDDHAQATIASASSLKLKKKLSEAAVLSAVELAKKLKKQHINEAIFDRGSHRYAGCVRLVAETLRKEGIKI